MRTAGLLRILICQQNFRKYVFLELYDTKNSKRRANRVDPVEVAHYKAPHLYLPCCKFSYCYGHVMLLS